MNWVVKRISPKTKLEIHDINFEKEKYTNVALFVSSTSEAKIDVFANNKKLAEVSVLLK